ncbi:MAG: chemotaxis protein CheA [Oscillospiraceae bacterium]|nr:chemotaxis protein CheA [Oscillospiraceae bacterium]
MSTIDPSMANMLEVFISESIPLFEALDEILLESEKAKNISERHINEIFRIMHTIKGSAGMMGLEEMSTVAHAVEDVFFIIRQDSSKLDLVINAIFDLIFKSTDFLKAELDIIQGIDAERQEHQPIIDELHELVNAMNNGTTAQASAPKASGAADAAAPSDAASNSGSDNGGTDGKFHRLRIFFEEGCQMENIRAFALISQVKDLCDELESVPANPESDSNTSAEIVKNGLLLKFVTDDVQSVVSVVETAVNVQSYELLDEHNDVHTEETEKEEAPSNAAVKVEAAPAAVETAADETKKPAQTDMPKIAKQNLISVNQVKLDQLMDLVGEIVTAESMVSSNPDLKGLVLDNFYKSTRELRKLTDELQDVVMSIRMVPLSGTFQKMNRIVRDMGKKLGKSVELVTVGGDTEVDKTINDSLSDPLMHMVRNSVDHAIESPEERIAKGKPEMGTVTLSAQNIGGEIVITIADDGSGMNTEKLMAKAKKNGLLTKPEADYTEKEILNFIMMAGFSTNTVVTEYSGRGVGMDVVRKNIEKVGGTISIDSKWGVGTTFTIKIPLTLAIVDGMELAVGDTIFTMPITSIKQSFKISDPKQIIYNTDGTEMIMLRGECFPVIRLHQIFDIEAKHTDLMEGIVLQIEYGDKMGCIFADELIGEQQVVVKPFPQFLNKYNIKNCGLSGCTILGDGSISLILDANTLLNYFER